MDPTGGLRRPSKVPQAVSQGPSNSRIASFSDIAEYESYSPYHDQSQSPGPTPPAQPQYNVQPQPSRPLRGSESMVSMFQPNQHPLRGSESMVSMLSEYNSPSPSASDPNQKRPSVSRSDTSVSGWSLLYHGNQSGSSAGSSPGFQPTPPPTTRGRPTHQRSRTFSRIMPSAAQPEPIREEPEEYRESIDMATLTAHAAPMGRSDGAQPYAPVAKDDPEDAGMLFDPTGFMGPTTAQDEAFSKAMQEQEASGKLTGGLGVGFQSGARIRESQLLATSPIVERKQSFLARAFSRRAPASVQRHHTLRALGQREADKRGDIVEVTIEEPEHEVLPDMAPSNVDVSNALGPNPGFGVPASRKNTIPLKEGITRQKTEVFYPQPDWKPFSMRWPYLLTLIVLSIVLGGIQEVVFQTSERQEHRALLTFKSPRDIPPFIYFAFKFVPTIITVGFGVLWSITDSDVKRLEAFYQLSKDGGAPAAESINVDYVTNYNFLNPFRAIYCRHYAVALSTVTSLLAVSLVPTLGAASIVLQPDRETRLKNPGGEKYITIDPVWSRFLTVVLFFIALLGCILFWQLQSRRSGLLADVRGIAGLASMAVVSHILMDFKDMDVATHQDIHHKLKHHRYVLRNSSLAPDDDHNTNIASLPSSNRKERRHPLKTHLSSNPHPLMLRSTGGIPFATGIVLFAGFLPIVLFTPASAITDRAAWVLTALAVCIKLAWGALDTSVRMMEPYYILARRHAPPKTLTLDYTALPFGWVAIRAALNRHLLVAAVGAGTVMTELLTIVVTSLATVDGRDFLAIIEDTRRRWLNPRAPKLSGINSGQETEASFWFILGLALFILAYMASISVVVLLRRRKPFLPRQPNTIASVLAFIHQSKMLYGFVGTAKLDGDAMLAALEKEPGRTFGLGWFEGRDGQTHCGVDEEELMSSYRVGHDYSRSNKPWQEEYTPWL